MDILPESRYPGVPTPSFEILEGQQFLHNGYPFWVIKVAVQNSFASVAGWAFLDPNHVELRFELEPDHEPPGFFTGRYLLDAGDNNSLRLLFENPNEFELAWIQESIIEFLNKCRFCVKSVTDMTTGEQVSRVISLRCGSEIFSLPSP